MRAPDCRSPLSLLANPIENRLQTEIHEQIAIHKIVVRFLNTI